MPRYFSRPRFLRDFEKLSVVVWHRIGTHEIFTQPKPKPKPKP